MARRLTGGLLALGAALFCVWFFAGATDRIIDNSVAAAERAASPSPTSSAAARRAERLAISEAKFVPSYRKQFPNLAGEGRKDRHVAKVAADICSDFDENPAWGARAETKRASGRITYTKEPSKAETKAVIALSVKTVCPEHKGRLAK